MIKQNKINWKIVCTGIICIAALEAYALSQGVNGLILTSVIAIIAGIAGWTIPQLKTK